MEQRGVLRFAKRCNQVVTMKSNDVLDICKRLMDTSLSAKHVSDVIGVCRQTTWRWFVCSFQRLSKIGRTPKISAAQERSLCKFVCDHPCTTLMELSLHAHNTLGIDVSQSTLSRLLKRNNITRKKATVRFQEQKQEKVESFVTSTPIDAWQTWSALDEASFTLNLAPLYGYGIKGKRVVVRRPGSRGLRLSLLLYVSPRNEPRFELLKGGIKATTFQNFLRRLPCHETIVLDNASIHHAKSSLQKQNLPSIEETAKEKSQVLRYLPPYTPQLNPTELAFNVLKHHVRKVRPRSESSLLKTITDKLSSMSFAGFFRHCWHPDSIRRCIAC
jgi:transposase